MHISSKILSKLFKTKKSEIEKCCYKKKNKKIIFNYLNKDEIAKLTIKILKKIEMDKQIIASKIRKSKWQKGWEETFLNFKKNKKITSLVPKFYTARENKIFRLGGKFIKVKNKNFEVEMVNIYRNWYFKKYFSKVENIYEFGAGSGHNLLELSKIYPYKNLFGSDFVNSSVRVLSCIAKVKDIKLKAFKFNMITPNKNIKILKNSGIYTSGAIEQLSGKIENFIQYLISQKPKVVVHVEPCVDFYNENELPDLLGKIFQNKRGYTSNLLSYLKLLEKKNKIKIIKLCKSPFGSMMIEGYNLIVWKVNAQ